MSHAIDHPHHDDDRHDNHDRRPHLSAVYLVTLTSPPGLSTQPNDPETSTSRAPP